MRLLRLRSSKSILGGEWIIYPYPSDALRELSREAHSRMRAQPSQILNLCLFPSRCARLEDPSEKALISNFLIFSDLYLEVIVILNVTILQPQARLLLSYAKQ